MAQSADEIVASLADNEAMFNQNPEAYAGFIRKVTKTRIDFHWKKAARGKPDEMTINKHGVICSRQVHEGKNWYGYTLEPFGQEVAYSVECAVARKMLAKFITAKAH